MDHDWKTYIKETGSVRPWHLLACLFKGQCLKQFHSLPMLHLVSPLSSKKSLKLKGMCPMWTKMQAVVTFPTWNCQILWGLCFIWGFYWALQSLKFFGCEAFHVRTFSNIKSLLIILLQHQGTIVYTLHILVAVREISQKTAVRLNIKYRGL